ncbi:MAG TPA: hypothetical protein VLF40_01110 [Candidatus Saccharimonadales bacterium]|nr:hypothetical protein [Candidatus Saccharimonadales bacterium]
MAKTAAAAEPVETDFTPALDAAQNQLGWTFDASDSLDSKALAILGAALALGIFALQSEMNRPLWLLLPFFTTVLLAVLASILVILPLPMYRYVGNIDFTEHPEYLQLNKDMLALQLLADTQHAIHINLRLNSRKTGYCFTSLVMVILSIGLLAWCIL